MPEAPTTNGRSNQYFNRNECRTFNIRVSTSMVRLSGRDSGAPGTATGLGQECSEVFISNKTGQAVTLFDRSDAYQIIVCNNCGMITSSQEGCIACAKDKVTTCNIPYAAKLLTQELMSMGIKVVIKPKE